MGVATGKVTEFQKERKSKKLKGEFSIELFKMINY
jgi:hypothetical protein